MNNYTLNNLKNSERKLKIFINDLVPFVKQLILILSVNEVLDNDFEIISNNTRKLKFHSDIEKTFKIEFDLNKDKFNIENNFFKLKEKTNFSKNRKAKNIILNSIVIENNRTEYFILFKTKFRTIINNKLEVLNFDYKFKIGEINLNNKKIKFLTYNELFDKFKNIETQYNVTKINKLSKIYSEYVTEKEKFEKLTVNFENKFNENNLQIMLKEDFNSLNN